MVDVAAASGRRPGLVEVLREYAPELSGMGLQALPPDVQEVLAPVFMRWLLDLLGPWGSALLQNALPMQ